MSRWIALVCLIFTPLASADVPLVTDLRADAALSRIQSAPIVVMFSADYCHFCQSVKSDYIEPLTRDPELGEQVIVRIITNNADKIVDFDGKITDHTAFAQSQNISLVPVVRFFGPNGERLAEDIVGKVIADFYWSYLERSIILSRQKLKDSPQDHKM